ncbi:MAG: M56 family metallopeptidase, partial [Bacteroidaceae bacterium]|nr:M56 family metallopeptidase [Bacteroidaceae bacterium]
MTTFFLYLIKSVLCLTLFYPFYMVLLSRETFHRFNRLALLSILLVSVVIPTCRITTEEPMLLSELYQRWEHWLTGEQTSTATMEINWEDMELASSAIVESDMLQLEPTFSLGDFLSQHWGDLLFAIYLLGIVFLLIRHAVSLVRLFGLLRKGKMQRLENGIRLYLHPHKDIAPFSWMKYIVISEADYHENGRQIVAHEQAHISNHHSWDLLLVELCLLAQWFNPAAWLLRQELQNIHEYEADDTVLRHGINAKEYQLLIIKKAVGARLYSLANSLNHSSLKKRLTMMMKEKSHPWARLKYLYVLPLAAISMVAFAHTEAVNNSNGISEAKGTEVSANEQTSIVNSSKNGKVLIIVDGKLTIQDARPTD